MWTRYHIECHNCNKTTNVRVQIPDKKKVDINFLCPNTDCKTELKTELTVNFENPGWEFNVLRGKRVTLGFHDGDYFYEFSDTLPTTKPSSQPHQTSMATMRMPPKDLLKLKMIKEKRKIHSDEDWDNFKDLTNAYGVFNKKIIAKLAKEIIGGVYPDQLFDYTHDLDYHRIYFSTLNYLVFPWVDSQNHANFVKWLSSQIFRDSIFANNDFDNFAQNILTEDECTKLNIEITVLINQFVDLKENFRYAYNNEKIYDEFTGSQNFQALKNFYTDCFEFIGRTSHIIFRLQNIFERGTQDAVPTGVPRNVVNANVFSSLNHGDKLDILMLSSGSELKEIYQKSFDNKLRNGINHFKSKLDENTQIISYYPITKRPEEEYQIKYIDFLNNTLDIFNSVLKIAQVIKAIRIYKVAKAGRK